MKVQSKRLSILSQPEIQEVYSVPVFSARDREHFFTFTEDELAAVKLLHTHRHRIYFLAWFKNRGFRVPVGESSPTVAE